MTTELMTTSSTIAMCEAWRQAAAREPLKVRALSQAEKITADYDGDEDTEWYGVFTISSEKLCAVSDNLSSLLSALQKQGHILHMHMM
jgi:hypothetical protein